MESSSSNGLGKLLPKSMAKRRRKPQKGTRDADGLGREDDGGLRVLSRQSTRESDDANSINMADEEDMDDRSFGSYESGGADPDHDSEPSRSRPPQPRRTTSSTYPSQVGYRISSPIVQASHFDSQTELRSPIRSKSRSSRGFSSKNSSPNASRERLHEAAPILEPLAIARTASPDKRVRAPPPRISTFPPRTPPTEDTSTPAIVNTPPTPVERIDSFTSTSPDRRLPRIVSGPVSNGDGNSPTRTMNTHRRTRSGSASVGPSKLSNITLPPLSPTPESGEGAPSSAGFFSSMFSAAQNAASTISSNIQGTGIGIANKTRTNSFKIQPSPAPSPVEMEPPPPEPQVDDAIDKKESAVRTLGAGELSLSQLGIPDATSSVVSLEITKFPDLADTRIRSESAPADTQTRNGEFVPEESESRPRSMCETLSGEQDQTTPQPEPADSKVGMQRSASGRSDSKPQRKRGSSLTAAGAVGVAIPAPNAIHPGATAPTPKLTGFAIASKKRNRDFHSFFKSVPDDDYLIEDYSCALQREILAHGRLYVSEGHLCFSSNILGWTTTLVMSFDEIVSVEKRSTALVFKNGLMISTLHAKHIFASFTSRDATYDLIVNIWKLGHPTLKSTLNGVQLEGTGGDKTEKIDAEPSGLEAEPHVASDSEEDSDDEEDFYDEEESEQAPESQATEASGMDGEVEKSNLRKVSGTTALNGTQPDTTTNSQSPTAAGSFPGPATHAPTDCGDSASHYEKILVDEIVAAPLGKVYNLIFGEASAAWMGKWITENQKCFDLQMEDKKGLSLENRTRNFTYIKPLNAPIGPRQTKCIVTETVDTLDYEKAVHLSVTTQNPDVPSGNIFRVKTKYCLSWAENNATRVQVNCTTEWSGKSWLKGTIERNINEGQAQYCKDLIAALRTAVSSRPRSSTLGNGTSKKGKKGKKSKALESSAGTADTSARSKNAVDKDWGMFEPVRGLAEPVIDILRPILTGNIMYGLLVGLLVATWFGFGFTPSKNTSTFGPDLAIYNPYRFAAYEEMWRREESELWDWLEERVGLERLAVDSSNARKKAAEPKTFEERLREERMNEREVGEAIRVTEEKLKVLREVMARTGRS